MAPTLTGITIWFTFRCRFLILFLFLFFQWIVHVFIHLKKTFFAFLFLSLCDLMEEICYFLIFFLFFWHGSRNYRSFTTSTTITTNILFLVSFSTSFKWRLKNSKFHQLSTTILSIQSDLILLFWMVSILYSGVQTLENCYCSKRTSYGLVRFKNLIIFLFSFTFTLCFIEFENNQDDKFFYS